MKLGRVDVAIVGAGFGGAAFAWRLSQLAPRSFALTMNDYGFALATPTALDLDENGWRH